MPPKLTTAKIDEKLSELRAYVITHQENLSARRDVTLRKTLKQDIPEEGSHYYFLHRAYKQRLLSENQEAHVQETFALLQRTNVVATATSSSSSSAAPVRGNDEAQSVHAYASPKRRKTNTVSSDICGNEVLKSKRKRKSSEGTRTESGAIPPARRTSTKRTNKNAESFQETLSADNWAELHEFKTWLSTPEAQTMRQVDVQKDKQAVEHLLTYPPFRNSLEAAAAQFGVKRLKETAFSWHNRCVKAALQRFRWWKQGGFSKIFRQEAQSAVPNNPDTSDGCDTERIQDLIERQNFWWTTVLTRIRASSSTSSSLARHHPCHHHCHRR